jgi:3-isopropylmalate/(R)-2-methylmalate dehydratase small subunit
MPAPFTIVRGAAAPLLLPDVDTDVLAPAHSGRGDLAASAFAPLRYRPDGTEDPKFVLNDERFRGAPILLAGRNFGCGSSREAAVWALHELGVRCVVAPSFGDIFAGNCVQNGVLPIVLDPRAVESLARVAATGEQFVVDLEALTIRTPTGESVRFTVDATRRRQLLAGLDDLGSTLLRLDDIARFQEADRARRPWVYDIPVPGGRP